jgi:hypothetical protein
MIGGFPLGARLLAWHFSYRKAMLQVAQNRALETEMRVQGEAEAAFNLSHANIVNTMSHDMKRVYTPSNGCEPVVFKLYMVQVSSLLKAHRTEAQWYFWHSKHAITYI